ncbi:RagB/SusD family nutrient uptake outer membrane protein [Chitinophaga sp. RAB17]|uniref:RagB/SusD family nutrient uptake outer membrane protein n=1 Tax=Chitinophaga sp. RAB17 TaxID=3233049 RepID=UPI003F8DB60F
MKHTWIILAGIALLGNSCRKNILEAPPDIVVSEDLIFKEITYTTEFVTDIYGSGVMPFGFNTTTSSTFIECASDDAKHVSLSADIQRFGTGAWTPDQNPDDVWTKYYGGIGKCNKFFEKIEGVPVTDHGANIIINSITAEEQKQRLKGEAYFLRAWFYAELIKRYGGVPLLRKSYHIGDAANVARSSYTDCVNFILTDCDSAFNRLPADYTASQVQNYFGRATKWAAQALKARVLLYAASALNNPDNEASKWQQAMEAATPFVDGTAPFALTDIRGDMANYEANFRGNAYSNKEMIWVGVETSSNQLEFKNYPVGFDKGNGGVSPSQNLVDAYEMKTTGKPITDAGSGYDPAKPYNDRDPRLDATILRHGVTYKGRALEMNVGGKDGPDKTNGTVTGYYLKKFLDPALDLNTGNTARHFWIFFRLPEMLLSYAEARNELLGPDDKVYSTVNMIRKRVGMPDIPAGLSKDQMRERIRNERRVELAFEGHRWWDVRRWKIAEATLGSPLRGVQVQLGTPVTYTFFTVENRVFQPKMYRYPIPQYEINVNNAIGREGQNPGW